MEGHTRPQTWQEFVATLDPREQAELVGALHAGLQAARQAAQVATDNRPVAVARTLVDQAIDHLQRARVLLDR